jgi:hypothetical protein
MLKMDGGAVVESGLEMARRAWGRGVQRGNGQNRPGRSDGALGLHLRLPMCSSALRYLGLKSGTMGGKPNERGEPSEMYCF